MSLIGFRARNHPQQVARYDRSQPDLWGNTQDPAATVDDRAITADDFASLHARFRFTIDAAASPANARLPRYWTESDNALEQSWADERVWCNPPYSNIRPWVVKAWDESNISGPELVVMLVPANRTEQAWWQDLIEPQRDSGAALKTLFLPGRLRFVQPGQSEIVPNDRPPFGSCLLV